MPSPFPGVDPYIENSIFWKGFHNGFITFAAAALNAILPAGYAANYEERVYVVPPERSLYPDILVLHKPTGNSAPNLGAIAVLEAGAPHGILTVHSEEVREGFVEVRSSDDWDDIITIIELLSPANKAVGSIGRDEYLQKQSEILRSATNLLEIDLLRKGFHTVAAPLEGLRLHGQFDAVISLHLHSSAQYPFWLNRLPEPLPAISVPLASGTPSVVLDLQNIYDQTYNAGPYSRRVDYRAVPTPPLDAYCAEWADSLLREKGLRP